MAGHFRRAERILGYLAPALLLAAVGYFGYNTYRGDYGLIARERAEMRLAARQAELAGLDARKERLENLTGRLRRDSVDLDLLEERSRDVLGYAHPDDVILIDRP